ncbi:MAG: GH36-type glycosyl hydrolase domain-containing protein [Terrimicrobiaceae bacterium]
MSCRRLRGASWKDIAIRVIKLRNWRSRGSASGQKAGEQPLRSELFSLDQLVAHARELARSQRVSTRPGTNRLLERLDENAKILQAFNRTTLSVDLERRVTHAAEWLLDNFYLIEEEIQTARRHLPPSYSRELPRLINGSSDGFPRVYGIVLELISHVDAQIDLDPLSAFVTSFQTVAPLKLGELWAIPIMLRLGLIENLQRVTTRLDRARRDRDLADKWMSKLQEISETVPSRLVGVLAEMAESELALSSSFVAEFCQRLSRQSASSMHWVRNWLEQRLAEQGDSIEQLVHQESQMQAADQVSVSHSINSLRFLAGMNWKDFVESVSHVEMALRKDPAEVYSGMDFATRDSYRHVVEEVARAAGRPEAEVAEVAIRLAGEQLAIQSAGDRRSHVGYFLYDKGRRDLEIAVEAGVDWKHAVSRTIRRAPMASYLGSIFLLTALGTAVVLGWMSQLGLPSIWLAAYGLVLAAGLSQLAVSLTNLLASLLVTPRLLPRLDYSAGIPAPQRTVVVIPTILAGPDDVTGLIEALEIHYLANRDANLHFALLTDFADAPEETLPGDDALIESARQGIDHLNHAYQMAGDGIFFLLHRPRRWNECEGCWMGFERKRGKLSEFNGVLLRGAEDRFSVIVGDRAVLRTCRFVITLDTDTQLPRGAAAELVGTMAHPLNRPVFHPQKNIVTEGYGILQPRVGVSLPSVGKSWFARIFSGEAGIDPYTHAASDVYQDVFDEGSFIGKGIYDIEAFERAAEGRFPENLILSHDLIEACHARSGLVSDVELYEAYPARYLTDANRRHRWIRGDWQIIRWLWPWVSGNGNNVNPLSNLSRWKIVDNIRRSLVPVALTAWFLAGILSPPRFCLAFLVPVFLVLLTPALLAVLLELFRKPRDIPWLLHVRGVRGSAERNFGQAILGIVFLPSDAFLHLDAILRTAWRGLVSGKNLLEWKTSSDSERSGGNDLRGYFSRMWISPAVALAALAFLLTRSDELPATALFLGLWFASPWIAWRISQPTVPPASGLSDGQHAFLRMTARKTWRFFETFVTAEENWLPPDNFQEAPGPVIASRTSPTNLGLALLANLAARDFGYIPVSELITRTQDAFASMAKLRKHRGHFLNWYDTRTLEPLRPFYVSSVDSGNLAGHLLTLGPGLAEFSQRSLLDPEIFAGLRDIVAILKGYPNIRAEGMDGLLKPLEGGLRSGYLLLLRVRDEAGQMKISSTSAPEEAWWLAALERGIARHTEDLLFLAPWLALPARSWTGLDAGLEEKLIRLQNQPTLQDVAEFDQTLCPLIEDALDRDAADSATREALLEILPCLHTASDRAGSRILDLDALSRQCSELANMDFQFLFDVRRNLFSIGFNIEEHVTDAGCYDLLASEARLCSYVAIALGQVPQDHWFSLGRLLQASHGHPVLASWSGSLFEYLMPLLVMPTYEHTLLDQTYTGAVEHQIEYGRAEGIPWGVSESGYNRTDVHLNYQYRAFGVPGLGLKRGLADDRVIAPYATVMALMVLPEEACENLQRLLQQEREGRYGFYEAVDYTPSRLPPGQSGATIRSFMAHHQGMSLLSLDYVLRGRPMQRRFLASPLLKATDLLLHERVPKAATCILSDDWTAGTFHRLTGPDEGIMRVITNPGMPAPDVHLMSNGRYHMAITSAGGGYSQWQGLAVNRWREDATRDCWGTFIYLRDEESEELWSTSFQPTLRVTHNYEAVFTQSRAEFRQRHLGIESHTEIAVSPEDDLELRRVTLTNHSDRPRTIELTSYSEVVIAPRAAEAAHPAFSNLFVETEFLSPHPALLCTRRARSVTDRPPCLFHLLVGQGGAQGETSYETDRAKFVGRGGSLVRPAAMQNAGRLSQTVGPVLDPIVSLRRSVTLQPGESARMDFVMGMSEDREGAVALVDKYNSVRMADRTLDLAWTHSQVTLRQLNITEAEAQLYSRLASSLIYSNPSRRAAASVLLANRRGQSSLWSYGISGDLPILLLCISDRENIDLACQLIQGHSYWHMKGLGVDLVILNDDDSLYRQPLHEEILGMIAAGSGAQMLDRPGGIFVRHVEQISNEDRILLQSVARIVLMDENGTLAEQMERPAIQEAQIAPLLVTRVPARPSPNLPWRDLVLHNGLGGFTSDGREYVTTLKVGETTPAPWVNVLANATFGTVVSESGSSYTWSENCHEFRLTPWTNDPVSDTGGEFYYIRDEQTGRFWSPTPSPARGTTPYVIRHGFGYSVFEHIEEGISSELWIYVATDASVKFGVLKIRNVSEDSRRISVTGCWDWVLGDSREKNLSHLQTEIDPKSGALMARNPYNTEFPDRIAFIDVNDSSRSCTGDRREFLGRNGTPANPAALKRTRLSGKVGAGFDPCGAVQVAFDLEPGREREVTFRVGVGRNVPDVQSLIQRFRRPSAARVALEDVWQYWNHTLGAVQVETPDVAANILANGWLLYQTLCCRMWARTGFYQSGGAYGFRDQLQDTMALVHAEPGLAREHLLRAASRQFREGDVQHWWHPPQGRGVRTHFSDDFLWLPYVTCRYVAALADIGVLDEPVAFIEGRLVRPEEESCYDMPSKSSESATLYEHCVRAIKNGLRFGVHGLPLIGSGDWNDGMNMIGHEGRGESVWLAFFLHDVLTKFADLADSRLDAPFAIQCRAEASKLSKNIDLNGWDGDWYRRAYFDNGEPLGSSTNPECQIDALPQSWAVISHAGNPDRARRAMSFVDRRLVREDAGLVLLFDPPFDQSDLNPGYVKGYIPGVRENGGQYTHAAIWTTMAFALLGETEKAWELFQMLNPIRHGDSPEKIATYKVEPYVVAADVYGIAPHTGRGGWTWYTGSAGWMYRLLVETLIGVERKGDTLNIAPRLPASWPSIKIHYRYHQTQYHIEILRTPDRETSRNCILLDGQEMPGDGAIPLIDDGRDHAVEVRIPLENEIPNSDR